MGLGIVLLLHFGAIILIKRCLVHRPMCAFGSIPPKKNTTYATLTLRTNATAHSGTLKTSLDLVHHFPDYHSDNNCSHQSEQR